MRIELAFDDQLAKAKEILAVNDLSFDLDIEVTLVAIQEDVVGTISLSSNIIKGLSVLPEYQGQGIATALVSKCIEFLQSKGINHHFAYSKENNNQVFRGLGFTEIVTVDGVTLFEGGYYTIDSYLKEYKKRHLLSGEYASIVMNLNPMTLGHLYLIETAAMENAQVLVFVVEEDQSEFPFDLRYKIAKEATGHLKNVTVVPSTEYMISKATFSTYFIKDEKKIENLFNKIDFSIFTNYFAPVLGIKKRYIGTEPYCAVTAAYNEVMLQSDFEVVLVERKRVNEDYISASLVRKLMKEDIDLIKDYVPDATFQNLKK